MKCLKIKGFTLVEILVVISIIGVLAGLLLSAIGKARQRSSRMECQSQLRQIVTACQLFEQDKGEFPKASDVPDLMNKLSDGYIENNLDLQKCPSDSTVYLYNTAFFSSGNTGRSLDSLKASSAVVVRDSSSTIHTNGANLGFADGHVAWYNEAKLTGWATKGNDPYSSGSEW